MFGHELTYAQKNPDYNTFMAQQQAHIKKHAKEVMPGTEFEAGTPYSPLMPKGMADGTDYAKYYNAAAAGEQVVGKASTRRPI